MRQLAVKAAVGAVSDLGEFTAIAATYDVDRVKDRIVPGAFEQTIAHWLASGKQIPVHWNHSAAAKDIIGAVGPATVREIPDKGLYVAGRLDLQDSLVAREAWRSMKNNTVALSFGYLATKARRRRDGIQDLLEIDLFEITVAPGPANPETRFLDLKAAGDARISTDAELRSEAKRLGIEPPPSARELRHKSGELELEAALGWRPPPEASLEPVVPVPTMAEQRRRLARLNLDVLMRNTNLEAAAEAGRAGPTDAELRERAAALGVNAPRGRRRADSAAAIKAKARDAMLALLTRNDAA